MNDVTRKCIACQSPVQADYTKCANCGEWREDIKKERQLCGLGGLGMILSSIAFWYGRLQGWWPDMSFSPTVRAVVVTFAWSTFFSSPSGLLIAVAFGMTLSFYLKYYISVARKTGKWSW